MMTMTLQPSIDVRPNDAPATLEVGDPPLNSDDTWQRQFLPSALRLLKAADQALHNNRIEAQRCIAELTSLLVSAHAPDHAHPNVPAVPAVRGQGDLRGLVPAARTVSPVRLPVHP